jgi:hypothetical protein
LISTALTDAQLARTLEITEAFFAETVKKYA